ncbi:uncharacterized protein J4E78_002366 [Alternaria triticimaculans]|uniref:uncharacterized protein n=1 Tax=Alternaria triticimaculans TaxID=297637 RepID=UPI0020C3666B|nr:uncharacterized protein J4E78_002366 [Alternaria triticimaculans]KAI4668539.1 hypothetical protein J4E78_002366 [Alternaria triticimaculans]
MSVMSSTKGGKMLVSRRKPVQKSENVQTSPKSVLSNLASVNEPIRRGSFSSHLEKRNGGKREAIKASWKESKFHKLKTKMTSERKTKTEKIESLEKQNESTELTTALDTPSTPQPESSLAEALPTSNSNEPTADLEAPELSTTVSPTHLPDTSSEVSIISLVADLDQSTRFLDDGGDSQETNSAISSHDPPLLIHHQPVEPTTRPTFSISDTSEQLQQIRALILMQAYDFLTEMPADTTTMNYVDQILRAYRVLLQRYSSNSDNLQQAKDQLKVYHNVEKELRDTQMELRETKGRLQDAEKQKGRYDRESTQQKGRSAQLERQLRTQLSKDKAQWLSERKTLLDDHEGLMMSYSQQIQNLQKEKQDLYQHTTLTQREHDQRYLRLRNEKNATITDLKQQIDLLTDGITRAKKSAEEQLSVQKATLKAEHEHDLLMHDEDVKKLRRELHMQKSSLTKAHTQELQQLQERSQSEKVELDKKHDEEMARLRSQREELKVALVVRDHFKGLKDRELTARYKRISTEIENFASMEWNTRCEANWPLSEAQLMRLHPKNTRRLKQQIVQHSMWVLLYEHIFSLPFKVFGKEGVRMNNDWTSIYDLDVSSLEWPTISSETEKQRYETARSLLTAIEAPGQGSTEHQELRTAYSETISTLVTIISQAIERVASLNERDLKLLDALVNLSGRTWLECCSQRYRLIMQLPIAEGNILNLPRKEAQALTLVVSPELKRYGSSQGEQLHGGEPITGWKGLTVSYPA